MLQYEVWEDIRMEYDRTVLLSPPSKTTCACLTDVKFNGVMVSTKSHTDFAKVMKITVCVVKIFHNLIKDYSIDSHCRLEISSQYRY